MFGTGTLINTIAVIAGSGIGIFLHKGIKKELQASLMCACGVATIFMYQRHITGNAAVSKRHDRNQRQHVADLFPGSWQPVRGNH